jgi:transcriptional regulator with XRE-family HTH domain
LEFLYGILTAKFQIGSFFVIENRIKEALKAKGLKYQDLAKETGIAEGKWAKALNGHNKLKWEEVEAICKLMPEYSYWLTSGKTAPESGQISPEIEKTTDDYHSTGRAG